MGRFKQTAQGLGTGRQAFPEAAVGEHLDTPEERMEKTGRNRPYSPLLLASLALTCSPKFVTKGV